MNLNKPLIGLAVLVSACAPAHSALVFTLQEVGPDVVLSGSGTLNWSGLTSEGGNIRRSGLSTLHAIAMVGSEWVLPVDFYSGFVGPASFGTGGGIAASSAFGDVFGLSMADTGFKVIAVPEGYVSGSPLSGTATFAGQTLASLGATPGTYTWTWGSGATADSLTLSIGTVTAVPEPSAYTLALAGLGMVGVWSRRQKAQKRRAEAIAT